MNLPVRPRWIVLAVVTLLVGGELMFKDPPEGSHDPVEAATQLGASRDDVRVIRMVGGPTDLVGCQENCWFAGPTPSKIVVYQEVGPSRSHSSGSERQSLRWSVLGQHGTTWHRSGISGGGGSRNMLDEGRVLAGTFPQQLPEGIGPVYRWGIINDYLLLIGDADADAVEYVEVEYGTGLVTRDAPLNDLYVSLAPASAACEIRARGFDGEIIERISVHNDQMLQQPNPNRALRLCERS